MAIRSDFDRFGVSPYLSEPVRLRFAGFEGTTHSLQQAGWSLSAAQDPMNMTMRLALRHEDLQLYGVTDEDRWDYHARSSEHSYRPDRVLYVRHIASRLSVRLIEHAPFAFQPIDATPQMRPSKIEDFADLVHFAPPLVRTKQIILPEASVPELMERILKLQEPGREEHFKRLLKEEREGMRLDAIPRQKFHAQILSVA